MPDIYETYDSLAFARAHYSTWVACWFERRPWI